MTPTTPALSSDSDRIALLALQPGEDTEDVACALEDAFLHDQPRYEILTCMQNEDPLASSIKLDGHDFKVAWNVKIALTHLRAQGEVRRLWLDNICTRSDRVPVTDFTKKIIHTSSQRVLIWIGSDHEDEDPMNAYLGEGSAASTSCAFAFASAMAAAEFSRPCLRSIMETVCPGTGLPSWCYLARLLYRPWFRELPLLRTNYATELRDVTVLCGTASTSWLEVQTAAERARTLQPTPRFIQETCQGELWPGMSIGAGREWLRARKRFGFSSEQLLAQIHCLIMQIREAGGSLITCQVDRLHVLAGLALDAFNMKKRNLNRIREAVLAAKAEFKDLAETNMTSIKLLGPVSSLPFDGWQPSPPSPEFRAPFVHTPLDMNDGIRLLLLAPHKGAIDSPIQCGLIHASWDELPPFAYVLNATLKDYRLTSLILLNGQSFRVPQALGVFLRHIRRYEHQLSLFVWKVCVDPYQASIQWRGAVQAYMKVKGHIIDEAAYTIDMYDELEKVSETAMEQFQDGMTKVGWLLELMDEAEVNELPEGL